METLDIASPIGALRLTSDGTAITRLDWTRSAKSSRTNDPILKKAALQLAEYFAGRRTKFDLPLRPDGTDFQKSVWRMMQKIPAGKTRSYGEVAANLNSGARAVGTACGRNPIPIIIPCHRILGANGAMGGYSGQGGTTTKQKLLALEAA